MAGAVFVDVHNNNEHDAPTEGSRRYAIIVCLFASLGGIFFGYDQGVTSGVLIMDSFINDYCTGWHNFTYEDCTVSSSNLPSKWVNFTVWYSMSYYIGCVFGAFIGGIVADKLGRRMTVFSAGFLFCIGTIWVCFNAAQAHGVLLVGRFIQGLGVGNSSFSLPLFGAEMAPKELRGFFSGFMQMTVVTGLFIANVCNVIIENADHGWRITNGIAIVPPIIVVCGIFCVPESPRWVFQRKGRDAAEATLKTLRMTENVAVELKAIEDQLAEEGESTSWKDLLEPSVFKRVFIGMSLQVLQQLSGINPIFTYGGLIFKDITGSGNVSVLILSAVNFVSTIPGMRWVDTTGRRKMLLIGAVGMLLGHVLSAITFTVGCDGNVDDAGCSKAAGYIIVAGTAFFIFNFAMAWGPIPWVYAAEIFPLNVRAKAVSLTTMANWVTGVIMTQAVKVFPSLNINGVFFVFAGFCAIAIVYVYYLCPETKGMLLEDIEKLFHPKGGKKGGVASPKYVEVETPVHAAA
jgi:sugar porter (SP) family MFS transporter